MESGVESTEWLHLTPGEEVLWAGTPSLIPAARWLAFGFGLSLAGVWLARETPISVAPDPVALCLLPFGLFVCAWAYLARWSTRYVFTTKAVYEKRGLLSRTVTRVRLVHVQNTTFEQSFLERVFSYGDIAVCAESGGVTLTLSDVPTPERVTGLVAAQIGGSAARSPERQLADAGRPTS